ETLLRKTRSVKTVLCGDAAIQISAPTGMGFFLTFTGWCDLFAHFDKIVKPVMEVVRDRN
ncbi:MAG: hypothetical protein PHQ75_15275, partial [Thermoguttaceae bacterium]|nr:hypothetical protein [Thermoguttaceae bacterium]